MTSTLSPKKTVQVAKNSLEVIPIGNAFEILQISSHKMVAAPLYETAKQADLAALQLKNMSSAFKNYAVKTYNSKF